VAVVSVTDTKKAVLGARLRNALPLIGLSVAVIVNAAWIGFFGLLRFQARLEGRGVASPISGAIIGFGGSESAEN
jgi:hypothetical protein